MINKGSDTMFCPFCGNKMKIIEPKEEIERSRSGESTDITIHKCNKCGKEFKEIKEHRLVAPDVPAKEYSWSLEYSESQI